MEAWATNPDAAAGAPVAVLWYARDTFPGRGCIPLDPRPAVTHVGPPVPDPDVISRATDQGIVADGANPGGHRLVARDVVVAPQGKVLVATSLRSTRICMRCPRGVPMPSTPHQTAMLGLSPGRVYGMIATARKRLPASRAAYNGLHGI